MLKIYLVLVLLVQPLSFSFSTSAFQFQPSLFSVSALCLSVSAPLPFSFNPLSFLFQSFNASLFFFFLFQRFPPFNSAPLSFFFQYLFYSAPFSTSAPLFFCYLCSAPPSFFSVQRLLFFFSLLAPLFQFSFSPMFLKSSPKLVAAQKAHSISPIHACLSVKMKSNRPPILKPKKKKSSFSLHSSKTQYSLQLLRLFYLNKSSFSSNLQ